MAEYKNGVNSFGNMSVDSNDVNADVHTGRVVFVDTDKYEKDTAYKAKIDKCVEDGFFRSDEFGSGGGGGASGMVVETEWITDIGEYHDSGLITTTSASDIFEAFDNGSNVVIHFIKPESGGSSIQFEEYGMVIAHPVNPSSSLDRVLSVATTGGSGYPQWCNKISVENGKILFWYYSD